MAGRTWKGFKSSEVQEIKEYLLLNGGIEQLASGEYEEWRIKFSDTLLTSYSTGTIYATSSASMDPAVDHAWDYISRVRGAEYVLPTKDFLIGFDETGKGEVFGHTVLVGALIPAEIFSTLIQVIGPADTKKKHPFKYWDELFFSLDHLRDDGFNFIVERIPPWDIDKYNVNKIMDITYQRILNNFFRQIDFSATRIVIDDYKIGDTLQRFLNFLGKKGAEIIVVTDAESKYIEAKLASLVAKRYSQASLNAIRNNDEFHINGLNIGSGNAGDPKTKEWLAKWKENGKKWPWFIKKSFRNIQELDKVKKWKKITPPIKESLLTKEYRRNFNQGNLSIKSLAIDCPHCGAALKSLKLVIQNQGNKKKSQLRCTNNDCSLVLNNLGITLRYYCGFILPDTNAVSRKLLSGDLQGSKMFENFSVLLSPVVRKETTGIRGATQELTELQSLSNKGRINLESPGSVNNIPPDLGGTNRDELIITDCINQNSILLSADKAMTTFAVGKGVFTIQG